MKHLNTVFERCVLIHKYYVSGEEVKEFRTVQQYLKVETAVIYEVGTPYLLGFVIGCASYRALRWPLFSRAEGWSPWK